MKPDFPRSRSRVLLLVGLGATAACLPFPRLATAQEWRIEPDPLVSIGGLTEDPDYTLSRVVGGLRLSDGRIVVADHYVNGLRAYTEDGSFLEAAGREGEGPGEYQYIRGLDRCDGRPIVAFDIHWGMKLYGSDLELLEERPPVLPGLGGPVYRFDCGPSGHWAAVGWGDARTQFEPGLFVATAPVVLGHGDRLVRDFGERLSSERIGHVREDGNPAGSEPHPFGRETVVAVGPDRLYLGDGVSYRIEVHDLGGEPLPSLEWEGPDLEITSEHREAFAASQMEGVSPEEAPARRRWLRDLPEMKSFPAYDEVRVDRKGNLWVRHFPRPGQVYKRWIVFDPAGRRIGGISLPRQTSLLDMAPDYILAVERDEMDVETVRLYRLSGA